MATAGKLADLLVTAGYKPEQIDVVVITHGHPDHIGGLMEGGKPVYPNARYVFGEAEFDYWKKGENIAENRKANREQFMQVAVPFGEKATFLKGRGRGRCGHPLRPGVWTFARNDGLPYRERRPAAVELGRRGQPLRHGDPAARMARVVRRRQGDGRCKPQRICRHVSNERLPVVGYHMPFRIGGRRGRWRGPAIGWVPASYHFNL
jgi:glyoxylase-like metal-dependent hydrolase (beta-lactamase superfamily II)